MEGLHRSAFFPEFIRLLKVSWRASCGPGGPLVCHQQVRELRAQARQNQGPRPGAGWGSRCWVTRSECERFMAGSKRA
jgi:hypothetical protein